MTRMCQAESRSGATPPAYVERRGVCTPDPAPDVLRLLARSRRSAPLGAERRDQDLHPAPQRVELDTVRPHGLRHFAATRLLVAGVPVRTVSGRLAHANAATTLGVYAHLVEQSDRDAAEMLSALVNRRD